MTLGYILKLSLKIHLNDFRAQKIDDFTLETFKIVLTSFPVENKLQKALFFKKTFLLAELCIKVVLRMAFFIFKNKNIKFIQKKFIQRFYIIVKTLLTTKQIKIIDTKKFAQIALNKHIKVFVIHVTYFLIIGIHPAYKVQIALLVAKKVKILTKYSDFSDIFLRKKTMILLKTTESNQENIKMQKDLILSYRLIYSLGLIELKKLKTYIEINLANNFIQFLKLSIDAFILFVGKSDGSIRLYIDY